jgi:GTPase SAR1 family protein
VILLGDAAAGKTYTVQRLLNGCQKGDYHTETTHGILIEELHPRRGGEDYTVRIWDFGGQDIMNEMHRCFLTERTCYVILVDTRNNGQTQRARHWLRTIQSVAPEAPVVLLVNEMTGGVNLDLDGTTLQEEYPNLKEIHHCSARTAEEEEFRREVEAPILRQALEMDSCKMTLPESWEQVRQELLALREKKYYIDRADFHTLCDTHGVPKDDQLRVWLLNWFNDMGVCFSYHFEEGRERQEDYKILEPAWLTSAIYRLIWEKKPSDDGIITRTEIDLILRKKGSPEKREEGVPCLDGVSYDKEEQG